MLWISNQIYLNQAYLRGGIEKCCRKKIEQEIVLKRNYSKILCKSIMTQVCIDEQQNVKRWQNFTKRSHIFPEPEKHTVSIFNRVLLSESERIAALLRKRKYNLTTTSAWLQKLVIQGISVFPGWEGRGGSDEKIALLIGFNPFWHWRTRKACTKFITALLIRDSKNGKTVNPFSENKNIICP